MEIDSCSSGSETEKKKTKKKKPNEKKPKKTKSEKPKEVLGYIEDFNFDIKITKASKIQWKYH